MSAEDSYVKILAESADAIEGFGKVAGSLDSLITEAFKDWAKSSLFSTTWFEHQKSVLYKFSEKKVKPMFIEVKDHHTGISRLIYAESKAQAKKFVDFPGRFEAVKPDAERVKFLLDAGAQVEDAVKAAKVEAGAQHPDVGYKASGNTVILPHFNSKVGDIITINAGNGPEKKVVTAVHEDGWVDYAPAPVEGVALANGDTLQVGDTVMMPDGNGGHIAKQVSAIHSGGGYTGSNAPGNSGAGATTMYGLGQEGNIVELAEDPPDDLIEHL